MRKPILLDNTSPTFTSSAEPQTSATPMPSERWHRSLRTRVLGGVGIAAVLGASVALAVLAPYTVAPQASAEQQEKPELRAAVVAAPAIAPTPVAAAAAAPSAAPASAVRNVQYVGDVKLSDRPCEEQTWPYIAKHCLKQAPDQAPAATAKVEVDRAEIKTSRASLPTPAPAPRPEPAVTAPAPVAAAPMPAPKPMPRPIRERHEQAHDAFAMAPPEAPQTRRSRPAREARDLRSDSRRAQIDRQADRNPERNPVVRRWTEAEYDVPGPFGTTRRVMVIRQQPVHQAAAFDDER